MTGKGNLCDTVVDTPRPDVSTFFHLRFTLFVDLDNTLNVWDTISTLLLRVLMKLEKVYAPQMSINHALFVSTIL